MAKFRVPTAATFNFLVMRQSVPNTLKLPRKLLDELAGSEADYNGSRKKRHGPINRKEQRKAARVQKKSSHIAAHAARRVKSTSGSEDSQDDEDGNKEESAITPVIVSQSQLKVTSVQPKPLKSILKVSKSIPKTSETGKNGRSPSPALIARKSRRVQEQLAADDAEIEALEKALGIKRKKKLPRSFRDEGLDDLLEGIDDAVEFRAGKRKKGGNEVWLERKRQKAQENKSAAEEPVDSGASGNSQFSVESRSEDESEGVDEDGEYLDDQSASDKGGDFASFEEEEYQHSPPLLAKKGRENPYVAPIAGPTTSKKGKYIPPSLRKGLGGSEDLSKMRRQLQGLLNRLSEANLTSILNDVEKLYRDHSRQHVSTTLLDLLFGLLSDPTSLQDTFIILHAGFIAAMYKVSGFGFGAQAIQRINEEFFVYYDSKADHDRTGRNLVNLISLLAELYNFQVISSNLIYDFIQLFLNNLSETNTELLLKIIRNAGLQLRQDDPSSLRDIVIQLQKVVAQVGEESLSARTKFMVETMDNLKNNRMKTGVAASTINYEHRIRMKKILGSLNQRTLRASEPLRIGLKDLQDTEKRGKWWLVGASYKDDTKDNDNQEKYSPVIRNGQENGSDEVDLATDLAQLAKAQRMNTDVRCSIFIAIMSSSDFNDAYVRLMKLGLKKSQELEIPKVLIRCAGAEKVYNPFYTVLSRKFCSDKKLRMAFQFSLWDLFKQMGEGNDEPEADQDEDADGKLGLRGIVNLARMFGVLVAEGGLSIGVMKNLNLAYLQTKTRTFVELMLITAIVHSQQDSGESRNEKALMDIFLKPKEIFEMAGGLRYFLRKVVSKTDVAASKLDRETVKWGCKVANDALTIVATRTVPGE